MRKFEIVNALIARRGYRKYLEICTPATGLLFGRVDRERLQWKHRLMYRCPAGFNDGWEITFRSEDEQVGRSMNPAMRYDLIFVDPFHSLECSLRDLEFAADLLEPGGAIIVHDCSPPTRESATAWFRPGSWCGLTYNAYIKFVLSHPELVYYTVDTDFGCGVIRRWPVTPPFAAPSGTNRNRLLQQWQREEKRSRDMFDFFCRHRRELLNLISVKEFLARENIESPLLSRLGYRLDALLWKVRLAAGREPARAVTEFRL
jgi:hypothetical protein